jgi:hypothetical protein
VTSLSVAAVCLVVGVVTYPAGWDSSEVKRTCGTSAGRYELGECGLRWACLLAVIGCLDAIILAALAFILATRHVRLQAEPGYTANGSVYKGEYSPLCPEGAVGYLPRGWMLFPAFRTQSVSYVEQLSALCNLGTHYSYFMYSRPSIYETRVSRDNFITRVISEIDICQILESLLLYIHCSRSN